MARDNRIIRPPRPSKTARKVPDAPTREQRVALLVQQVLGEVNARIDARHQPPTRAKRKGT
ncbi:MAG: hypothetical protein AAFP87_01060 [Pseudomonadota bacterium]